MNESSRDYAINLLITMVVQELAQRSKRSFEDVFSEFRRSRTYANLFDPDICLWMNGPDYIADEYIIEMGESFPLE